MDVKRIRDDGVERNQMAQDWAQWWVPVNMIQKFGFHKMQGISYPVPQLSASQVAFWSIKLILP